MTNAEAIEYIKKNCYGEWCEDDWREAMNTAIEALEKQIPVKPIHIDKNKEFDGNWKKVCPFCKRVLIERITTNDESYPRLRNYTPHCKCGQAIDWEGEG